MFNIYLYLSFLISLTIHTLGNCSVEIVQVKHTLDEATDVLEYDFCHRVCRDWIQRVWIMFFIFHRLPSCFGKQLALTQVYCNEL